MKYHEGIRSGKSAKYSRIIEVRFGPRAGLKLGAQLPHVIAPRFHVVLIVHDAASYEAAQESAQVGFVVCGARAVFLIAPIIKGRRHEQLSLRRLIWVHQRDERLEPGSRPRQQLTKDGVD